MADKKKAHARRRPRKAAGKRSLALLRRAERVIPGGVNSPVRAYAAVGGSPPFIARGKGAHIWDARSEDVV